MSEKVRETTVGRICGSFESGVEERWSDA